MLLVPDRADFDVSRGTARVVARDAIDAAFSAEWRSLAGDVAEPNAFGEDWFVKPAICALGEGQTIRLITARDGAGRLIGIMPMMIAHRYGRIPVQHVANWTHFQCFMGTPLVRRGSEGAFWQALLVLLDQSDWATGFLSVSGLLENGPVHAGLIETAARVGRPSPTVHRAERAVLMSDAEPEAYLAASIRPKKRKELRRLAKRLGEQGSLSFATLTREDQLSGWCDVFLALEASGWKGTRGSAFANTEKTADFFRNIVSGAFEAGRLDFQRLDLDGRAIAMLVNFRTPPGSWSFKIAYDEGLARFSPGVLIELENLPLVLGDPDVAWMDSCAVEDHPMINSLWTERRAIVQVSVPLSGARRQAIFATCRAVEAASATLRKVMRP